METKAISEHKSLQEFIKSKVNAVQKEISELALQFSLGKAEAKDKFEDVKKDLAASVHDLKREIDEISTFEVSDFLKSKIDELSLQLHLGKAESKELFEEQMKNIRHAIAELESRLKEENIFHEKILGFNSDLEKFRLQADMIGLKFQVKSIELNDRFHNEMANAKDYVSKIVIKMDSKAADAKEKLSDFSEETMQAFEHLKSAVKSLGKS